MLPPKEIPDNLTYQEYLKLFLRYQILGWQRQIARSSRMVMKTQPPSSNLSEDAKTKMAVLMTGLEGVIIVRDIQQGITEHAGAIVGVTASQAGQLMALAIQGQAEGCDTMARVPAPAFPGGPAFRSPLLVLAMTWFALRDRLGV